MAYPIINLYQTLQTFLRDSGAFKSYDIDMGQMENEGKHLPLEYPAALIKLDEIIWRDLEDESQIGTVNVTLKMIFQFKNEDELITMPGDGRPEVIEILGLVEDLNATLTGAIPGGCNKLRRYNQYHLAINPENLLWTHVIQYQTNIRSDGGDPEPTLDLDFDALKNNNAFMERKKFNVIHK